MSREIENAFDRDTTHTLDTPDPLPSPGEWGAETSSSSKGLLKQMELRLWQLTSPGHHQAYFKYTGLLECPSCWR